MRHVERTPAHTSRRYSSFIQQRDRGLERIHRKTQLIIADSMKGAFVRALSMTSFQLAVNPMGDQFMIGKKLDDAWEHIFQTAAVTISSRIMRARKYAYLLAAAGETEAMARTGSPTRIGKFDHRDLGVIMNDNSPDGGTVFARIRLYLSRLRRDLLDAFQLGMTLSEKPHEIIDRMTRKLPDLKSANKVILKRPKLQEAADDKQDSFSAGRTNIPQDEWDQMVNDYKEEYIPTTRGPEYEFPYASAEDPDRDHWYGWEGEQTATQDFVEKVRAGQVDAAERQGVKDFIWISVIDNKTDDCCVWRNGLSSAEIRAELKSSHRDDECQVEVPPAHFNCRCTLAPMLEGMPEVPPVDYGDFDEWLNDPSKQQTTETPQERDDRIGR